MNKVKVKPNQLWLLTDQYNPQLTMLVKVLSFDKECDHWITLIIKNEGYCHKKELETWSISELGLHASRQSLFKKAKCKNC